MSARVERSGDAWLAAEPGLPQLRVELARLARRARRRKLVTLVIAVAIAGGAVLLRARQRDGFEGQVLFRVDEGRAVIAGATPTPTRVLRDHVVRVELSGPNLATVMAQHRLARLREQVEVRVWRTGWERSAHMTIGYRAGDAASARAVAADLGQLVVDEEDRRREMVREAAAQAARGQVQLARSDLDRRREQIARLELELPRADPQHRPGLRVQLDSLAASLGHAQLRLARAERTRGELERRVLAENTGVGLRFERVGERVEQVASAPRAARLALRGVLVFVLALPLVVLLVGAFDSRVYDLEDVRRLGLVTVGHVPPFRGDHVGSLRARAGTTGGEAEPLPL